MLVPNATGPPKTHSAREVLNVSSYIVRGGCAWRPLPPFINVAMSRLMARRLARS
jgi:transposase